MCDHVGCDLLLAQLRGGGGCCISKERLQLLQTLEVIAFGVMVLAEQGTH